MFRESEYEIESQLDEGSCDEEEDCNPISEGAEEYKEFVETPKSERRYTTQGTSLEVRSRTSSHKRTVNTNSTSAVTSEQGSPPLNCSLNILDAK